MLKFLIGAAISPVFAHWAMEDDVGIGHYVKACVFVGSVGIRSEKWEDAPLNKLA